MRIMGKALAKGFGDQIELLPRHLANSQLHTIYPRGGFERDLCMYLVEMSARELKLLKFAILMIAIHIV